MRRYESVFILDPELTDDDVRSVTERYTQIIKDHQGEVIKVEDWGYRRLAYLVRKKERGRYILLDYVGMPDLVNELERQFKIAEQVMKFLTVKVDDDVDLEAFKTEAQSETTEPVQEAAGKPEKASPDPATPTVTEGEKPEETTEAAPQAATESKPEEPAAAAEPQAAEPAGEAAVATESDDKAEPAEQEPEQAQDKKEGE